MGYVIKRDGKKQAFNSGKIRHAIDSAARQAGLSASARKELQRDVADPVIDYYKHARVRAVDLRKAILGRLGRRSKASVAAWRKYDKSRKK